MWALRAKITRLFMFSEGQVQDSGKEPLEFVKIPGKKWSLVQTRPRHEKFSAGNLLRSGIITYIPLLTKIEIHNRSKRKLLLPMFPGYFFACPDPEEETLIRRDKCVWNLKVLNGAEEELLLKDLKIVRQAELLSQERKLFINPGIKEGGTVVLKKGPFKNQNAVVVKREDETTLIVNLDFLGRNILVRCDADEVEF